MNVFRSRKRAEYDAQGYAADSARMDELARGQAGFIDYKSFTAADGETVTISIWASRADAESWARHPEHLAAQGRGRGEYYAEYTIYSCDEARERRFP